MAAHSIGGVGELQVKSNSDATYLNKRHVVGEWKYFAVYPTEYKMRAFNALTGTYEFWVTFNPNHGPPSGAVVTNKTIAAILTDQWPTSR